MNMQRCQICHASKLKLAYQFKQYELVNYQKTPAQKRFCDLDFMFCLECSHLQQTVVLPEMPIHLFSTGETRTMRSFLRDLSAKIEKRFHLKAKDVVLDIGSNDGTFLRTYDISGLTLVGVEKSDELIDEAKTGIDYFIHGSWSSRRFEQVVGRKAKIITALHVLEQVEEPLPFLRDIEASLRDDGIFVLQISSLMEGLAHNEVSAFGPLSYHQFSLQSLQILLADAQLEIFDLEPVVVGGHALRVFCRKKNSYVENENGAQSISEYLEKEKEDLSFEKIQSFFHRISLEKKKLEEFLTKAKKEGKRVWIYGLSDKSETLLNFLQIKKEDISGVFELQEKRVGLRHSLLELPLLGQEQLKKEKPDYFLVLPYHFINEFYQREVELREAGTAFVLPLPQFRVIS